jgi:hypothetical protein
MQHAGIQVVEKVRAIEQDGADRQRHDVVSIVGAIEEVPMLLQCAQGIAHRGGGVREDVRPRDARACAQPLQRLAAARGEEGFEAEAGVRLDADALCIAEARQFRARRLVAHGDVRAAPQHELHQRLRPLRHRVHVHPRRIPEHRHVRVDGQQRGDQPVAGGVVDGWIGRRVSGRDVGIEADDEAAADEQRVERRHHARQVGHGRHGVRPRRRRLRVIRKRVQPHVAEPRAQLRPGDQREEQIAVIFNVERADDADVPCAVR